MNEEMFAIICANEEVLWAVVVFDAVNVVYPLVGQNWPADFFLCDKNVLEN